jgi:hypothetical protein
LSTLMTPECLRSGIPTLEAGKCVVCTSGWKVNIIDFRDLLPVLLKNE